MTAKAQWREAARRDRSWPSTSRVVRATALALARFMTDDGRLSISDERLAAALALPLRTAQYHRARLVEMGWLHHCRHGGNGRRGLYQGIIPGESCPQCVAGNSAVVARNGQRATTPEVARNVLADSKERERAAGERDAVDDTRKRQAEEDGGRGPGEQPHRGDPLSLAARSPLHGLSALACPAAPTLTVRLPAWEGHPDSAERFQPPLTSARARGDEQPQPWVPLDAVVTCRVCQNRAWTVNEAGEPQHPTCADPELTRAAARHSWAALDTSLTGQTSPGRDTHQAEHDEEARQSA